MSNIITVVEFAKSGIRLVTGYYFKGNVSVLQALEGESLPFDEAGLLKKEEAKKSLALLLNMDRQKLGKDLGVFIALYPPDGFTLTSGFGKTTTVDPSSRITQIDFINATNMINKQAKRDGKHILYDAPTSFEVDGKTSYDTFPIGKLSDQLTVVADCHMIDETSYQHYKDILNALRIEPYLEMVTSYPGVELFNLFKAPANYLSLALDKQDFQLNYITKRRLNSVLSLPLSIQDIVESASKKLGISFEKASDYFTFFGIREPGDLHFLDEKGLSLKDIEKAFKEALEPLTDTVQSFIRDHEITPEIPLILYGTGGDIDGLDAYLSRKLNRECLSFSCNIIGARSKVFTNCLGAILVSAFGYQEPVSEAKRKENDQLLKEESFGRDLKR